LAQQKQLAQAIEQFQLAIRLKPDYASAHYALGVALQRQGDRAGAERAFKLAQKLDSRLKPPSD
jgi:Flp pilus assembly protein TadD